MAINLHKATKFVQPPLKPTTTTITEGNRRKTLKINSCCAHFVSIKTTATTTNQMRKRLKDRPTTTRGRASNEAQIAETISKRCLDVNTISQDSLGCPKECIDFVVPLSPFFFYFPAVNCSCRVGNLNESPVWLLPSISISHLEYTRSIEDIAFNPN